MPIEIKVLADDLYEEDYNRLLERSPVAMFNHSLRYRSFIKRIAHECEDRYLCAFKDGKLVAALPVFIKRGSYGAVVNSLPFYGSHGGIVHAGGVEDNVFNKLFQELDAICSEVGAFSCTVIEPPTESRSWIYDSFGAQLFDERIGQITELPVCDGNIDVDTALFGIFHSKTRNMVRKGNKMGFQVSHNGSPENIRALHAIHNDNILSIGGVPKPLTVFEAILDLFRYDEEYRIYVAKKDGRIVSALLLFYFKDMVEYFTPATLADYRQQQPLSLLIYTAMRDAVVEYGSRFWNWGGTWLSQKGVYRFKSRWGARDCPYRYHVKMWIDLKDILYDKKRIMGEYKYFYLYPFGIEKNGEI